VKQWRFERHLIELLLVQSGCPIERAPCDAAIIHFMMRGKRGKGPEAETVSDPRQQVSVDAGVSNAGTGMRTRLQGLLSFLLQRSRLS
jgi:hypothetical protein